MRDPRLDGLAEIVVRYSTAVRPGDLVTIVGDANAMPGVEAFHRAVYAAGGHPSFHVRSQSLHECLLRHGSDEQLRHVCPFESHRLAECDVLIVLISPENTRYLGGIDPARVATVQAARRGLLTTSLQRKAAGKVRYCAVEIPTHAAAQAASMSLDQYADLVYRAGLLHLPDPLGAWRAIREQQARACEHLRSASTLHIQIPPGHNVAGTDLTVDISGGTWINCAGDENVPDGEIYTGPRSADGTVCFNAPCEYKGQVVEGVRLEFRAGRVVNASATRNEAFLLRMIDQDHGARNIGEIALGTNYGLTELIANTFFDEKVGGTFHLALGAGYPESGNANQSGLHWDMVCDLRPGPHGPGGTVHADGTLIQQNGRFVLPGWPDP